MLLVNREPTSTVKAGPQRAVYGRTNSGKIILPLDFVLYELDATGGVTTQKIIGIPATDSVVGAEVKTPLGSPFGKIASYTSPSIIGSVNPVVLVDPSISSAQVDKIRTGNNSIPSSLKNGDQVEIEYISSTLGLVTSGVIGQLNISSTAIDSAIFLHPSLNVNAYSVTFNSNLQENSRGARVILKSTQQLLGMLILTSNSGGKCDAWVYPAHLIPS